MMGFLEDIILIWFDRIANKLEKSVCYLPNDPNVLKNELIIQLQISWSIACLEHCVFCSRSGYYWHCHLPICTMFVFFKPNTTKFEMKKMPNTLTTAVKFQCMPLLITAFHFFIKQPKNKLLRLQQSHMFMCVCSFLSFCILLIPCFFHGAMCVFENNIRRAIGSV